MPKTGFIPQTRTSLLISLYVKNKKVNISLILLCSRCCFFLNLFLSLFQREKEISLNRSQFIYGFLFVFLIFSFCFCLSFDFAYRCGGIKHITSCHSQEVINSHEPVTHLHFFTTQDFDFCQIEICRNQSVQD